MITIDRVAFVSRPPEAPPYSLHGYCIMEDGTTYSLLYQWWHGALLALLYPELAAQAGYVMPESVSEVNVYEFQRFELDNHCHFPVIRICPSRMMGPVSIDRGCNKTTPEQIASVRLIMSVLGLNAKDEVCTDHKDMKVSKMIDYLLEDKDVWGSGERSYRKRPLKPKDAPDDWDDINDYEESGPMQATKLEEPDAESNWAPMPFEQAEGRRKRDGERNDE